MPAGTPDPELTRAGYTGHQHERDLGLIDMRGRMYDLLAGRFLSADPVAQAPFWSQGLNRYSYVFNDPANNTDPSGFFAVFVAAGHYGGIVISAAQGFGMAAAGGAGLGTGLSNLQGLGRPGSTVAGGPIGSLPREIPQGLRMCDSGQCLAQNAGDPGSTGTSGTSGSSSDVPAQPGTAVADEIATEAAMAVMPAGRLVGFLVKAARVAPWAGRMAQVLWRLARAGKASTAVISQGVGFFRRFVGRNAFNATTRQLGRFTEFAVSVPGKTGGSYTRWVKVVNEHGRTVRLYHDTFDKTGRFLHRGVKVPGPVRHVP